MKTYDIIGSRDALTKLSQMPLPMAIAVQLSRNVEEITAVFTVFDKKRRAIFEEYGTLDKDTEMLTVLPEHKLVVQEQLDEMLNADIEINLKTINSEQLGEDVKLSVQEVTSLKWLFDDIGLRNA